LLPLSNFLDGNYFGLKTIVAKRVHQRDIVGVLDLTKLLLKSI
jgi:hypothetical protein